MFKSDFLVNFGGNIVKDYVTTKYLALYQLFLPENQPEKRTQIILSQEIGRWAPCEIRKYPVHNIFHEEMMNIYYVVTSR